MLRSRCLNPLLVLLLMVKVNAAKEMTLKALLPHHLNHNYDLQLPPFWVTMEDICSMFFHFLT